MRISDWSSGVCSSYLETQYGAYILHAGIIDQYVGCAQRSNNAFDHGHKTRAISKVAFEVLNMYIVPLAQGLDHMLNVFGLAKAMERNIGRSEEHTSELQSLMRISYAVFCLKKKKK